MATTSTRLAILISCGATLQGPVAGGYTIGQRIPSLPPNHEKSVKDACANATKAWKLPSPCLVEPLVEGVREPDTQGVPYQMVFQSLFSGVATRRSVSWERVAAQHIHGNPLPLRVAAPKEAAKERSKIVDFPATLSAEARGALGANARSDLWAHANMGQLRNKMLTQAASWICVGLSHPDPVQKWKKFGNLAHMVGDTFSAAHTLRRDKDPDELLMSYSMDVVWWGQHVVGDKVNDDFRFKTLVSNLEGLMALYASAIKNLGGIEKTKEAFLPKLDESAKGIYDYLCSRTWKMSATTQKRPAGGATKDWSSAMKQGKSMLPAGIVSEAVFREYVSSTAKSQPGYFYPGPSAGDYCTEQRRVLACDWAQEVQPALAKSKSTKTLFVPQVDRSSAQKR